MTLSVSFFIHICFVYSVELFFFFFLWYYGIMIWHWPCVVGWMNHMIIWPTFWGLVAFSGLIFVVFISKFLKDETSL